MKIHLIILYLLALLAPVGLLSSCSESDNEEEEFPNWKKTNEQYFNNLYAMAKSSADMGDKSWKVIRQWSLEESTAKDPYDYIVVNVLENGTGSGCPLYTDSVKVHYEGRLLPSTSYPDGYVFDKSFTGEFNPATALPAKFAVSGMIDGFTTALQYMHIGDHWKVYIPYQLGYGSSASGSIPAYSTLVFDVTLVSYYRAGVEVPDSKARPATGWIEE
ncbi:FKBP-type peptidyl-prolyl cis-trans isomerase [Prevotella sp. HCN-7019]|uniref:FKBP-type peptidyl-prolyl cis-trans isomerase n=1 Tax=Prevotella sp. HCN-7019 TaxID=3134668 RepID=UPI0030BCC040